MLTFWWILNVVQRYRADYYCPGSDLHVVQHNCICEIPPNLPIVTHNIHWFKHLSHVYNEADVKLEGYSGNRDIRPNIKAGQPIFYVLTKIIAVPKRVKILENIFKFNYIVVVDIHSLWCRLLETFIQIDFLVVKGEIESKFFLQPFHFFVRTSITNHFATLKE